MTVPGRSREIAATIGDETLLVTVAEHEGRLRIRIAELDTEVETEVRRLGSHRWLIRFGNRWVEAFGRLRNGRGQIVVGGRQYPVTVADERARQLAALTGSAGGGAQRVEVRAPMPGLIVSIPVEPGQDVQRGDRVVVLQAMKMENELTSPQTGRVSAVNVVEGQTVEQGFVLVVLEGEHGG